ncbi:MAG: extracellular solute-binding protein [Candidatus Kapaibacterium sp.]
MNRLLRSLISALLVVISLSCNRGITPGVLRFSNFWSEPSQRAAMDSLIAGFRREHPEIPVEVTELSWADGKMKLMAGFNSQTAPDVLELGSDWVAQFSSSGVLEQLDSDTAILPRFQNAPAYSLPPGEWAGHYFAVPWLLDTRVIFINDDLLKKTGDTSHRTYGSHGTDGWDWQKMQYFAAGISREHVAGIGVNGPDEHRLYKKFLPYVWSNGGDLFDSTGQPTMDEPQNIQALQFYIDQLKYGTMETQKNLDDAFALGRLGIWFSGSWLLPELAKASFHWHTKVFPGNDGHDGESFAGGEYLAINSGSAMKREAELFLEYITRTDNELAFARDVNEYPADMRSQSDSFYLHRREGSVFTAQLAHAKMTPVIPQWLDVEAIIEDEVSKALYKTETPEQAMRRMQRRAEERMKQP